MDYIKKMDSLIVKATGESVQSIPIQLLRQILSLINQRVDMPKYAILSISKRLVSKNKRVLINIFVTLEYLIYQCQLSLYSQISSKELLFKISGLLMNKDIDPEVKKKVLQTLYCCEQLFRPHEDLLPLFFQFYAGVLRNGFDIPHDYRSPFRPQKLKQYKKIEKSNKTSEKNNNQKTNPVPSLSQNKLFQQIRQKLILTNEIIDNANPGENVKQNGLLLEMIQEVKQSQKAVNKTINQNPTQAIMQLALAINDDIFITYRRFKDLQKNRKPEPFILTQLVSDVMKEHELKKNQNDILKSIPKPKVEQKPSFKQINNSSHYIEPSKKIQNKSSKKEEDIFDNFQTKTEVKSPGKKISSQNIMDLLDQVSQKQPVKAQNSPSIDLLSMDAPNQSEQSKVKSEIKNIFDLLDNSSSTTSQTNNNYTAKFQDLMGTAQYNLPMIPNLIPNSSGNGINLNTSNPLNFQTQSDIKQYNNNNPVMDKFDELTRKFTYQ